MPPTGGNIFRILCFFATPLVASQTVPGQPLPLGPRGGDYSVWERRKAKGAAPKVINDMAGKEAAPAAEQQEVINLQNAISVYQAESVEANIPSIIIL